MYGDKQPASALSNPSVTYVLVPLLLTPSTCICVYVKVACQHFNWQQLHAATPSIFMKSWLWFHRSMAVGVLWLLCHWSVYFVNVMSINACKCCEFLKWSMWCTVAVFLFSNFRQSSGHEIHAEALNDYPVFFSITENNWIIMMMG